jgi:hypothetical protein
MTNLPIREKKGGKLECFVGILETSAQARYRQCQSETEERQPFRLLQTLAEGSDRVVSHIC